MTSEQFEVTILMPCLNEARTLGRCIAKATSFLHSHGIKGEVLVADNGSDDGSQEIALTNGARIVHVEERGYGSALRAGIGAARGEYIVMGDSDDSYDFADLRPFIEKLHEGYDLVMGNRFRGGIKPGAMPALHRLIGNPALSAIGRIFFRAPCRDFYCGLRAFRRTSILTLDLQASGMVFAHEMVVKAAVRKLKITEVPTTLSPDGRGRPPHLRTWRDGWRTLRFLLLFSPRWLFLYPGLAMFALGLVLMLVLLPAPQRIAGVNFDIHTLLYAGVAINMGFQSAVFWVFAKIYGVREGIVPPDPWFGSVLRLFTVEAGLIVGGLLLLLGVSLAALALGWWAGQHFGDLAAMRLVIPSATAILLGLQVVYAAFFVAVLEIRARPRAAVRRPASFPSAVRDQDGSGDIIPRLHTS